MKTRFGGLLLAFAIPLGAARLAAQAGAPEPVVAKGDSVSVKLVDVDLRAAVQALARYLDKPVIFAGVGGNRVTIETPRPVATAEVPRLLRGLLESQNYELFDDSAAGTYRVRQREAARPLIAPPDPSAASQPQGPLQLFAIHLRHARAADVAATVNALYGKASALGEPGRRSTLSRQLEQNQVPPVTSPQGAEVTVTPGGVQAAFAGEVTIVPDPRANSLLVRASARDFELVNAAVKELDIRPLQVLISVTIAEVRKDRSLNFGVGVEAGATKVSRRDRDMTVGGSIAGSTASDLIVEVLKIGPHDIDVTLSAAAARGDVSILSRPVVIAANNEEAELNVGSQRPFVQVARVLPTDNTARDQVVQYKDVGTKLTVRPTISPDGYVMLQVTQEVNQATNEASGLSGVDAPIISTRSVQTQLLIKDRQTVILGGLSDRQRDHSQGGVPGLSSIPWLGGLFGRVRRTATETELYLFITPQVIRDDAEAEEVTRPMKEQSERRKP